MDPALLNANGADVYVFSDTVGELPHCVFRWFLHCVKGGQLVCTQEQWEVAPVHCKRSAIGWVPRVCTESGIEFPPSESASGWEAVWRQWRDCEDIYHAKYVEVRWDPEDFLARAHWARGFPSLPKSFGLCFQPVYCSPNDVRQFLIPLHWAWVHDLDSIMAYTRMRDEITLYEALWERLQYNATTVSKEELPGRPSLHGGNHYKLIVYERAMRERALANPGRRGTAAACIVGMPRTFAWPEVHNSIRRNVLDSLGFEDTANIYVLQLERASDEDENGAHWFDVAEQRGLEDLAEGFAAIPPEVLITVPIHREGHPPHRRCNWTWGLACNALWKSLELCMDQVRMLESVRGFQFDWVLRLRTDIFFNGSLGDIRAYSPSRIHIRKPRYLDIDDRFALIPRQFADVYFSTRLSAASDYCWVSSDRGFTIGDCEFRLQEHLRRSGVVVEPLPIELYFTAREAKDEEEVHQDPLMADFVSYRGSITLPPRARALKQDGAG